jgi:hypothetical protein
VQLGLCILELAERLRGCCAACPAVTLDLLEIELLGDVLRGVLQPSPRGVEVCELEQPELVLL